MSPKPKMTPASLAAAAKRALPASAMIDVKHSDAADVKGMTPSQAILVSSQPSQAADSSSSPSSSSVGDVSGEVQAMTIQRAGAKKPIKRRRL